ncbi:hypothetical protein [Deinococcus maricopensis]|uniref:Uncharacterized protein n=1 Tax=Deinococcus maricopensis (strain DSM 21211 / LMG 22137 / NRRL B-23946 / LB-34) TaxID=709986 RepID=E8U3Y9_DEIML|nr:hypothetical protein [Deinococcus maricopensis]ADV65683.1 hypothetical protein Deima_0019 [Deinococcus maricopensis DSM 21211]
MNLARTWEDAYGSVHAQYEGRAGGHSWLVVTPLSDVRAVAAQLDDLGEDVKGTVHLLVADDLTPVHATLGEHRPRGAVLIGPALSGGPAVQVPDRTVDTGPLPYREGGAYPAWTSARPVDAPHGEHAGASVCAAHDVPVMVTPADHLTGTLRAWLAATPHALALS